MAKKKVLTLPGKAGESDLQKTLGLTVLGCLLIFVFISRYNGIVTDHTRTFDEGLYPWLALHLKVNPEDYSAKGYYEGLPDQTKNTMHEKSKDYLTKPLFKHPPFFFNVLKWMSFGSNPYRSMARVPPLMGCLVIVFAYLLAKRAYGLQTALLAAFFLAVDPNLWITSQKMWMETTLAACVMGSLYFFLKAVESRDRGLLLFVLSGICVSCAMNTKLSGFVALIVLLLFCVMYSVKTLQYPKFWAMPVVAGLSLVPWVAKNVSVYGSSGFGKNFIGNLASGQTGKMSAIGIAFAVLMVLAIGAVFFAVLSRKRGSGETIPKEESGSGNARYLYTAVGLIFLAALFSAAAFRTRFMGMFLPSTLPISPDEAVFMGAFRHESWNFYFGQLLILSPLYVFAYLIFFAPLIDKSAFNRTDKLLLVTAVVTFVALALWKSYQSRYALFASNVLLILAARMVVLLWGVCRAAPDEEPRSGIRTAGRVALIGVLLLALVKTWILISNFVLPNNMVYY